MSSVNVRFVLTGSCPEAYSGKQFRLEVPFLQADGARTTIAELRTQVRSEWPSDFPEMDETIKNISMKFLKMGRLLKDSDIVEEQVTPPTPTAGEETEKKPSDANEGEDNLLLLHIVFQDPELALQASNTEVAQASTTSEAQPAETNQPPAEHPREPTSNGCCNVM